MKKILILSFLLALMSVLISGCATGPVQLPAKYFEKQHEISISVVKIDDKPRMRDSGQGGLIGAIVNAGRSSSMQEIFDGIKGETVKELLRQQIANKLEGPFVIEEESKDLSLEITVNTWGWFLPTTLFGIKTGSYQLEIFGEVSIYELKREKEQIAFVRAYAQKPLGNDPSSTECQQALKLAIDEFAQQVAEFVLKEKKS